MIPVGVAPFRIQLTFIASPLTLGVDIREFVMSETEVISRRRALSLLGLAVLAAAVPAAILPISEAEAQQPNADRPACRRPAGGRTDRHGTTSAAPHSPHRAASGAAHEPHQAPAVAPRRPEGETPTAEVAGSRITIGADVGRQNLGSPSR